jgi:hypothetical protein
MVDVVNVNAERIEGCITELIALEREKESTKANLLGESPQPFIAQVIHRFSMIFVFL